MDGNHKSRGDRAESAAYESPRVLFAPGEPLTHSQGSQCLGDMTWLSPGEELHPHVASEKLVPMGNTQASQGKESPPKETVL